MEVALAVGGAFLSSFLAVGFERSSKTRKFIEFFQGKNVKFDKKILNRLDTTLDVISVVIEDAQAKQEKSTGIRIWLGNVKQSVNHAEDLKDELDYELLRLKLDYEFQHKQTEADMKVALNPAFVEGLMKNLEEVTARLEDFEEQIQRLGLQKLDLKEKYLDWAPSSSVADKSRIFGRDDEKDKLIQMVLSDGGASDVSVVAITGMGGIGKTTLAQLVYNDDRVKEKFPTRAWVCVSEEYDALRVTKALLMEVNSDVADDKDDFNRLQVKLKNNLAGKCFLIILDDIWNENYNDWSRLKNPLNYGSTGSKIIVTTRNKNVALLMQNEPSHNIQPISEDQSWSLFKSHAFDNGDHTLLPEFETIGKEIVKKCKGLPLAIKTVAGALRPKKDINVWKDFLSSEVWAAGGDILPALGLSYKHLPSHLKCCFSFCAVFPKDIPFKKDNVVLLWLANDLVKSSTQKDGREYFEELKSRSFFESLNEEKYIMHDLINDLARSVTGNTCIRLEDYQAAKQDQSLKRENELPPELLHFSYMSTRNETFERFRGVAQAQSLRTFLPIHQYHAYGGRNLTTNFFSDILPRFQRLRALNLSQYRISMVPDSIGDLKHLRFLNLASTDIEKLPNAICKCLNLQTLILKKCRALIDLPQDMRHLINLQHVDVRGVGDPFIKKMATWLSFFKDIQNIFVVVDKIHGGELELLAQLQLCHSLEIVGLEDIDVVTIEKAKRAGIIHKDYIENLSLKWSGIAKCSQEELNKLAKLQPPTNTKQLRIKGYQGTRFPEWLGDSAFSNMESLYLKNCHNCFSLPPFGQLSGLKKFKISGMDGISEIGKEFCRDASTSKPFEALEELKIHKCNNILSFPEGGLSAPNLKKLVVDNCKKMKSLPARMPTQLPLLNYLSIWNCPELECFPEGGLPSSLETLYIWNCSKMKSLPARMPTQLPLLNYLSIWNCPELECFPEGGLPSSLESLTIMRCSKMKNCSKINWGLQTLQSLKEVVLSGFSDTLFPEEGLLPTTLQKLYIYDFSNLESLNEKGLQHLSSLQSLTIRWCLNLEYLPQQKFSSSLSFMRIIKCPLVESFPEGLASSLSKLCVFDCPKLADCIEREKGEDWPKVSHIPEIIIDGKRI